MSTRAPLEVRFHLRQKPRPMGEVSAAASQSTGQLPRITQVLALAIHLEDMIRRGDATDYADVARLTGLCRERVSQIVRLNYLAPDIQIELLYLPPDAGRALSDQRNRRPQDRQSALLGRPAVRVDRAKAAAPAWHVSTPEQA